jgi:hypothetical protein
MKFYLTSIDYWYEREKKNFTVFIWESAFVSPIARRCSISSRAVLKRDKIRTTITKMNHLRTTGRKMNHLRTTGTKMNHKSEGY